MNEAISQDQFSQALLAYKQGILGSAALLNKFEGLITGNDFTSKQSIIGLTNLISDADLPEQLSGQLLSKFSEPKTTVVGRDAMIALAGIIIMILIYQAYASWNRQRVITAIHELRTDGIEAFQDLSFTEQLELLGNDKTRMALVQYPVSRQNFKIDAIDFIQRFDPNIQELLLKQRNVRELLIDHYQDKINHFIGTDNFDQAQTYSSKIIKVYPDSKTLSDINALIRPMKMKRQQELEISYRHCINQQNQSLLELKPCLQESRQLLAKVSPQHKYLEEPKLPARYIQETSSALRRNDQQTAENLLADWHTLVPENNEQRNKLELELEHKQTVSRLTQLILTNNNTGLVDAMIALSSLSATKRNEILLNETVRQNLLTFYTDLITTEITNGNYAAGLIYIDSALALFSNSRQETLSLKELKQNAKQYKSQRQKDLKKQYETILDSKEPDVVALQEIHQEIKKDNYPTRSKAIKDLIRESLIKKEWVKGKNVVGTITLVYDHHKRELTSKIMDIQHDYHNVIVSSQHVHLDHDNCLEVVIVKGETKDIVSLERKLKTTKGIKYSTLNMASTGQNI